MKGFDATNNQIAVQTVDPETYESVAQRTINVDDLILFDFLNNENVLLQQCL